MGIINAIYGINQPTHNRTYGLCIQANYVTPQFHICLKHINSNTNRIYINSKYNK